MANIYMIAGELLVMQLDTPDGGLDYQVWNFETAEFERDIPNGVGFDSRIRAGDKWQRKNNRFADSNGSRVQ